MTDDSPEKLPRRPRYRGANPRRFDEKYKEHQPSKYVADVAKVLAGGRTPAGTHVPIMMREILAALAPQPGEHAIDCTLGYGGHAQELLAAVQPGGRLIAMDTDPIESPKTEARLQALGFPEDSLVVKRMNYAGIARLVAAEVPGGVDMLLADLGLSSMQIDDPARGFTFKADGPLDMRMNPLHGQSAASLLSKIGVSALGLLLTNNADEPQANMLAIAILKAHQRMPLVTTGDLAAVIRKAIVAQRSNSHEQRSHSYETPDDTVRRVFQALRIAVNDEFGALDSLLSQLSICIKPKGRIAILSFHSGEDRRVKRAFKDGLANGLFSSIAADVIRPAAEERRTNSRSSAAKLRWAVRGNI